MAKNPPNNGKPWRPNDDAQLRREAAGNTPTRVLALHLGRSEGAIRSRAQELRVSLKPVNQSPYNRKNK
jgi:hypothetical protein